MNIENGLEEQINAISQFNGVTLSIKERLTLETYLDQLRNEIQCDEILFWGKITGVEKDYYIALAIYYKGQTKFPLKRFYFCTSTNFTFSEISEIKPYHLEDLQKINTYFTGNTDVIIKAYPKRENLKNLTEGDRLSYIIRTIEHDTSVVPIGAVKMLVNNEIRKNENFEGLSLEQIKSLKNFAHFRPVENKDKRNLIILGEATLNFDFLDSIEDGKKHGIWSIRLSNDESLCCIRSNEWKGYYAFCKAGENFYGSAYFGNGIKTKDISFMQQ